jgi:ABC-2 type transport system ATP-binding protein
MVLVLNGVTKNISKRVILNNISFSLNEGEVVGFVGPNGAGKTTTLKICVGLITSTSGDVLVNNYSIRNEREKALRFMGVLLDNDGFYNNISGYSNLKLIANIFNIKKQEILDAVEKVKLSNRINDKVKTYSLGMIQRLCLAKIAMCKPKVVLMDEPLNGIDYEGTLLFRKLILDLKNQGCAIIISSHLLSELEKIVDRVIFIKSGKIIRDTSIEDSLCLCKVSFLSKDLIYKFIERFKSECLNYKVENNVLKIKCDENTLSTINNYFAHLNVSSSQIKVSNSLEEEYLDILGENIIE